jgi:hypothetical protein
MNPALLVYDGPRTASPVHEFPVPGSETIWKTAQFLFLSHIHLDTNEVNLNIFPAAILILRRYPGGSGFLDVRL